MAERLRIKVIKNFKLHGFSLRSDACQLLVAQLLPVNEEERDEWLEKIAEHIQKQALDSPVIGVEHIELAVKECVRTGLGENETVLNVISAFEVPCFEYNSERKKFTKQVFTSGNTPQLYDVPHAKANLYRDRYILLHQRTLRHELFTPPALGMVPTEANHKWKLESIEFLLSSTGKRKEVIVLGLLTQLREGIYFLEDPTGIIELDMSETTGLHCENCFVLAEGIYEDRIFHVSGMGFPPAESSATSRAYFGNVNTFGGPSQVSLKYSAELSKHEQQNEDAVLVFLSDVWLDSLKVMEKLRVLFTGYADFPPVAFVFMGNFLSSQHGGQHAHILKAKLKSLGDLISQFANILEKSTFIFIPGPSDPASPNILPRLPLPKFVMQDLQQRLPTAVFATNPCRIQYCTQEIVVIREDLFTKMCRNTIHFPTSGDIPDHFAKTILCQAHLAPLPLSVCPVYWSFDAALQLYPLPNLVVVADQGTSFTSTYMECQVMNPGSFPKNEFSFKIYIPSTQRIEDSQIPNEY